MSTAVIECDLRACRVCTGCAHDRHEACRGVVRCPDTGRITLCTCCGKDT